MMQFTSNEGTRDDAPYVDMNWNFKAPTLLTLSVRVLKRPTAEFIKNAGGVRRGLQNTTLYW